MPRTRTLDPVPAWPLPGRISTPGARPLINDWMSETGATAVTSLALIVGTTFPMARFV